MFCPAPKYELPPGGAEATDAGRAEKRVGRRKSPAGAPCCGAGFAEYTLVLLAAAAAAAAFCWARAREVAAAVSVVFLNQLTRSDGRAKVSERIL